MFCMSLAKIKVHIIPLNYDNAYIYISRCKINISPLSLNQKTTPSFDLGLLITIHKQSGKMCISPSQNLNLLFQSTTKHLGNTLAISSTVLGQKQE